ncbi:MAG: LuxR C-terminal-related transcriptional regulator [Chitinophagaceae bacterium]
MLVPGTQMYWVTFGFVCVEAVILFYLIIHWLARPDDKTTGLNIILIILLLIYNITGGLLPDPNLPGSFFLQESIAYATGFITPCYFPYYVYQAFGLVKMKFHAYRGVYYFLIFPYLIFVSVFAVSNNLETAKNLLILPVLYALWVVYSLVKAIRFKYSNKLAGKESKEELTVLFLSIASWMGLPVIDYFDIGQLVEAIITNMGFLLLLGLHLKRNITQLKTEHQRLIESELRLLNWNEQLQQEVDKRTQELERISSEERFNENCKLYRLTNREKEIARLVCNGNSHKQVAETLFIAERTVAKHVQNIFEKVQVCNRMELCQKLERIAINHILDDQNLLK